MKTKKLVLQGLFAVILLAGLIFTGCKGEQGEAGLPGRNPEGAPIITAILATPDSLGAGGESQLLVAAYDPNGDSLSYAWTADLGTFATPNASTTSWTAPDEAGIANITVTVTANGATAQRSTLVGVGMRVPSSTGRGFLGDNGTTCIACHASITTGWMTTAHSGAFESLVTANSDTNNYCLQCHTTGFDDKYDHDGNLTTHGTDSTGYDNLRTANLHNVQCESCHGKMGPSPLNHAPDQLTNIVNGNKCDQCHEQGGEVDSSGHGTAMARAGGQAAFLEEWGGGSCNACHTSEGFAGPKDPNWSGDLPIANQINCVTCHDPHNKTNDAQLRTVANVQSPYGGPEMPTGYTISGFGKGQLCAQCHHGRRSSSQILAQINVGSAHPGPHESPQADMISGRGDYELAGTVERTNQHPLTDPRLSNVCASCHMFTIARGQPDGPNFGHEFSPDVRMCQQCHPGADDFNIGNVQTEFTALLDSLKGYLPHDSLGNMPSSMDTVNWSRAQREAGYTVFFVEADGSKGVHNRNYAMSVIRNAIAHLASEPN